MEPLSQEEAAALLTLVPRLTLFAITWSVGASCDSAGRAAFDAHLRSSFAAAASSGQLGLALPAGLRPEAVMMPPEASVYEWVLSQETGSWVGWMDTLPPFTCDPDMPFAQIIVPTADTVGGFVFR